MSFKQKIQYTTKSDYWNTPKTIYNHIINNLKYIDYNPENSFISPFNENTHLYYKDKVYINPPFSILSKHEFIETIEELIIFGNEVLLLIPARTDTKYFHALLKYKPKIYVIKGRLKFNDKGSAPFPSLFLKFNNYDKCEYITIERDLIEKEEI